jgi:hypothetical chaperone protein
MDRLGIDFGTTNSAVAIWKEAEGQVLAGDYEPTLLYFEESRDPVYHLGHEALEKFISSGLKGRFIRSIKSILHLSTFKYTSISGNQYTAEDLVALILTHLKKKAEALVGHRFDRVTLGRPARFSPNPEKDALAQDRLLKAAHQAGFKEVEFQLEPIAAAYLYEREAQREELVLVGDLGGGTADFTLMRLGPDRWNKANRQDDILGSAGTRVGGDDFDAEIAWQKVVHHLGMGLTYDSNQRGKILPIPPHLYRAFCRWENHFLLKSPQNLREIEGYLFKTGSDPKITAFMTILEENLGNSIFKSIESAKIDLSHQDVAEIAFAWSQDNRPGIDIRENIDIASFSEMIQSHLQQLHSTMDELLQSQNIKETDIDAVFLTGGSSLVRPVRQIFVDRFGESKIRESNAFTSVAQGMALSRK